MCDIATDIVFPLPNVTTKRRRSNKDDGSGDKHDNAEVTLVNCIAFFQKNKSHNALRLSRGEKKLLPNICMFAVCVCSANEMVSNKERDGFRCMTNKGIVSGE